MGGALANGSKKMFPDKASPGSSFQAKSHCASHCVLKGSVGLLPPLEWIAWMLQSRPFRILVSPAETDFVLEMQKTKKQKKNLSYPSHSNVHFPISLFHSPIN